MTVSPKQYSALSNPFVPGEVKHGVDAHYNFLMAFPAHLGPWHLIQFRDHFSQTVELLGRVISPSQGRYLNTEQHKHRINAYTHQTSMP
jgi:hypothetical protein